MTCYDVHREFLENMKKRQEKKVNDLLEDNKELLETNTALRSAVGR